MKNLETLYLDGTQVNDLSTLSRLKYLNALYLSDTQVSDLSPLAELKSLGWLSLMNTPVGDKDVNALKQALPNCRIVHSPRFHPDDDARRTKRGHTVPAAPESPSIFDQRETAQ